MKAKYDWSLVWQMVKEQKEAALSVDADKAGEKENNSDNSLSASEANVNDNL